MTALYDGCTVNVDVTDGTFFITITVDGTDAQKCANVANQLAEKRLRFIIQNSATVRSEHFVRRRFLRLRMHRVTQRICL